MVSATSEAQISGTDPVVCSVFEGAYDVDVRFHKTPPAEGVQNWGFIVLSSIDLGSLSHEVRL